MISWNYHKMIISINNVCEMEDLTYLKVFPWYSASLFTCKISEKCLHGHELGIGNRAAEGKKACLMSRHVTAFASHKSSSSFRAPVSSEFINFLEGLTVKASLDAMYLRDILGLGLSRLFCKICMHWVYGEAYKHIFPVTCKSNLYRAGQKSGP